MPTGTQEDIGKILAEYGIYSSPTRGTSMRPLFRTHRDVVVVVRPQGELRRYDVALYPNAAGDYVLHRVIAVREEEYLIRGDNTFRVEHVPKGRVVGVMTEFSRAGHRHTVEERWYRVYARVWNFLYPVRYLWHTFRLFAGRVYRKLFKRNTKAEK